MLGVLLGVGAALLLDRISNVISTTKQVRSITRLPVLGIIPIDHGLDNFESMHNLVSLLQTSNAGLEVLNEFPKSSYSTPFQEAFRTLNANIRLLNPDAPVRSIAISSPTPEMVKQLFLLILR